MRVLVTRAAPDGRRTAAALGKLGHEAVSAPVLTIVPRPVAVPASPPAALVATSQHAFGAVPGGIDRHLPVFAVGRRTAEAARAAGFRDVRVGTGDGRSLAPLVALTLPRPGPLLHLAGRDRKGDLEAALATAGYRIEAVEAYEAEPAAAWPAPAVEALVEGRIEAALHFSRRSAGLALVMAGRHDTSDAFLRLAHLCLSADVAEPLRAAGAPRVRVAERPDEEGLLCLLSSS